MWLREVFLWDINQSDLFLNYWFISLSWVRLASVRAYSTVWEKLSGKGVKSQCKHWKAAIRTLDMRWSKTEKEKGRQVLSSQNVTCNGDKEYVKNPEFSFFTGFVCRDPGRRLKLSHDNWHMMQTLSRSQARITLNCFTIPTEPEEPSKICSL